jgi:outer membrane receptor protein involved in Fe transport
MTSSNICRTSRPPTPVPAKVRCSCAACRRLRKACKDQAASAAFPSVAIYLDDQSGALPGRNLDVYAADLERIEVLEGPQGTIFGAGAESGVMRYITNKPKLDVTEGNVTAAYETTAGGNPSSNVEAVLNLPLIADTLAMRAVIYSNNQGGYINNIPATFSRQPSDYSIQYYYHGAVPSGPGSVTSINNAALIGDGINTVPTRASAWGSSTRSTTNGMPC